MEKKVIDRAWFLVKNMRGYDQEWEWMSEPKAEGQYLLRDEVLSVLDGIQKEIIAEGVAKMEDLDHA